MGSNPITDRSFRDCSFYESRASSFRPVAVFIGIVMLMWCCFGCKRTTVGEYLSMGDRALHEGRLDEAEKDYQAATGLAPADPRAHLALASLYTLEQKPALSFEERVKVLETNPRNSDAQAALAQYYAGQSQLPPAEEHYRAAIAVDGGRPGYHLELGSVLAKENKLSQAEEEFLTAIGLDPKSAQAHFRLAGLLSSESGRQEQAQAEYAQAHALDPTLSAPNASAGSGETAEPANVKVKTIKKKFVLTRNSQVFAQPDNSSTVVAEVHKSKFVNVTGITGDWLRVKLRTGTVGFVPIKAAE